MPPSRKSTSTHYDSVDHEEYTGRRKAGKMTLFDWLVRLPILLLMLGGMFFFLISKGTFDINEAKKSMEKFKDIPSFFAEMKEDREQRSSEYEATAVQDSYYVKALGRSCEWNKEYESYYDPETDCYFWYNDTTKTHTWQYWYEGISSDYGDYGWMEYDASKSLWYIEVSDGEWIELPSKYDRSRLWHIE